MNAPVMVEVGTETDPLEIAYKELREKKIPFIIRWVGAGEQQGVGWAGLDWIWQGWCVCVLLCCCRGDAAWAHMGWCQQLGVPEPHCELKPAAAPTSRLLLCCAAPISLLSFLWWREWLPLSCYQPLSVLFVVGRRRYLPDNSYEDWSLSELIIPER